MISIGVTGSFGTGKTFVSGIFRRLGAVVIDADEIARNVLAKGGGAYRSVVRRFGRRILKTDGTIDRRKLATVVFRDRVALGRLVRIIHPPVIRTIRRELKRLSKDPSVAAVVIDAPLLIEAGLAVLVDHLIVVTTTRARQVERCGKNFHISRREILSRIRNQMPLGRKIAMADFVVRNNGTKAQTRKQVVSVWEKICC